ncbi:MAG: glycosyltransferase [Acidobacteriota bacterium]|nr:MAG: glycosyltransferase [Acidobacteriota bacterium]
MSYPCEVHVTALPIERFTPIFGEEYMREAQQIGELIRERLLGRVLWNVNSTAVGGGVAEMLQSLLAYTRGAGIDTRWMVIKGDPFFFAITKRLHHALHGSQGDGSALGARERRLYDKTLADNATELCALVKPRDVVILHDPQTAGLAPALLRQGALVIWRCHIGHDAPGAEVERGWRFLEPYLEHVPAYVFSRDAYIPSFMDRSRATIIRPSIDAFSAKNQDLDDGTVEAILLHTGLLDGPHATQASVAFTRADGSPARVVHRASIVRRGRAPRPDTPLVVQVSRWDPLKDPSGVMSGFSQLIEAGGGADAELVLAGPELGAVADDPEAPTVFDRLFTQWRLLAPAARERIHLVMLPMEDVEENAAIVNALQRHATLVAQKSLHEGFGLTVTEAMWKARPVVASAVGGIRDQIEHGRSGWLLDDPTDLAQFGSALDTLLSDPARARRLGEAAWERVRERFLGIRHLLEYARLIERLDQ